MGLTTKTKKFVVWYVGKPNSTQNQNNPISCGTAPGNLVIAFVKPILMGYPGFWLCFPMEWQKQQSQPNQNLTCVLCVCKVRVKVKLCVCKVKVCVCVCEVKDRIWVWPRRSPSLYLYFHSFTLRVSLSLFPHLFCVLFFTHFVGTQDADSYL